VAGPLQAAAAISGSSLKTPQSQHRQQDGTLGVALLPQHLSDRPRRLVSYRRLDEFPSLAAPCS